jgi:hypothetical protein
MKEALFNFKTAERYERTLPFCLKSPILMFSGLTGAIDAKLKRDQQGQKNALLLVDRGGSIVRTTQNWENPYFIGLSLNRYHGVKSSAIDIYSQLISMDSSTFWWIQKMQDARNISLEELDGVVLVDVLECA